MSVRRIELRRSGGFAGAAAARTTTVDASALSASDRHALDQAVSAAKIESLPERSTTSRPMPDAMSYRLTIESDAGTRTITVDEQAASDEVAALIETVQRLGGR
jgi:hypothetical protein